MGKCRSTQKICYELKSIVALDLNGLLFTFCSQDTLRSSHNGKRTGEAEKHR